MKDLLDKMLGMPLRSLALLIAIAIVVAVSTPITSKYLDSKSINLLQEASARSIKNDTEITGVKDRLDKIETKIDTIYLLLISKKK